MPPSPRVVVIGPGGRGGVASVVGAVLPHLPGAELAHVGRTADDRLGVRAWLHARASARRAEVAHLHPSLRIRSLPRDLAIARAARAAGAGVVFHLHGYDERLLAALARSAAAREVFLRAVSGLELAAASEALAAALRRLGAEVEVLPNPVDRSALPVERAPDPELALFLGRLVPAKGAEALVRAARGRSFRVVVCGEGPLEAELRAAAPPNVSFEGWVGPDRRRELLATAGVLVHPSTSEASPLAVTEALAAGVPVVALRAGDVAELVGDAGRILDRSEELGEAVQAALRDPPDTSAARARILARSAPEAVAERWRALHQRARRSR